MCRRTVASVHDEIHGSPAAGMTQRIALTGATGFVGRCLLARLQRDGIRVVEFGRTVSASNAEFFSIDGLGAETDYGDALAGCDAVVHLAARVHVMRDGAADSLVAYQAVNLHGTVNLARQAAAAGVRRFVYMSSIKVNGERTSGKPFTEADVPTPQDHYGMSKWQAEQSLLALARETSMDVVIIRPPLVYGPGVKGNFAAMMRWVAKGIPMPLGAVRDNRRSLVGVDNLVDLIMTCLDHPAAANQVFLVSDGEDLSTAELLCRVARAMGRSPCLLPVPVWVLKGAAGLLGKQVLAERLLGNLQVDSSKAREMLGWVPRVSVDEGLRRAVAAKCVRAKSCK